MHEEDLQNSKVAVKKLEIDEICSTVSRQNVSIHTILDWKIENKVVFGSNNQYHTLLMPGNVTLSAGVLFHGA